MTGRKYNCLIVDDNKIDRQTTLSFIRKYDFLTIQGVFEKAIDAFEETQRAVPDVIFLDIDMPDINGLELREKLQNIPACIFITAYPDYALSGFEVNAMDFIVKPIREERFTKAMDRLHYFLDIYFFAGKQDHSFDENYLFIKEGHVQIKIRLADIQYLEALKDYTGIITRDKKYCVLASLGKLLEQKMFAGFVRIHRSYAVPIQMIDQIGSEQITIGKQILPVGRSYKDSVKKIFKPNA